MRAGLERGAIDRGATLEQAARNADLLYLAQPIGRILDTLHHLDPLVRPDALITDAGSTKHTIVTQARKLVRRCQFLGGHPLAGKEKRGAAEAEADLFRGRTYVLTPGAPEELRTPAAHTFVEWLGRIGAKTVVLGAAEHDLRLDLVHVAPAAACFHRAGSHCGGEPDRAGGSAGGRAGPDRQHPPGLERV